MKKDLDEMYYDGMDRIVYTEEELVDKYCQYIKKHIKVDLGKGNTTFRNWKINEFVGDTLPNEICDIWQGIVDEMNRLNTAFNSGDFSQFMFLVGELQDLMSVVEGKTKLWSEEVEGYVAETISAAIEQEGAKGNE